MDELNKTELRAAINAALNGGFDKSGKWEGDKFAIVVDTEKTSMEEVNKFIMDYLDTLSKEVSVAGKKAKTIIEEMKKNASSSDYNADGTSYSGAISIGSVFPLITEVNVFNPQTRVNFQFEFNKTDLKPDFEKALTTLKDKFHTDFKFFPQVADVRDVTADGLDMKKEEDLQKVFVSAVGKDSGFTPQELKLVEMYKLALGRSLKAAEIFGSPEAEDIRRVYNESSTPAQIWKEAKERGFISIKNERAVSEYAVLATDMDNDSAARSAASQSSFELKRNETDFSFLKGMSVSYGGVIPKGASQVENPIGVLGEQKHRFASEVAEINKLTQAVGPEDNKPFAGFEPWSKRNRVALKEREDLEKIEQEEAKRQAEADKKQDETKEKKTRPGAAKDKSAGFTNQKGDDQGSLTLKTIKPDEGKEHNTPLNVVGLDYKGVDIKRPKSKNMMLDKDSFSKAGDYFKAIYSFKAAGGLPLITPLLTATERGTKLLIRNGIYAISRINENSNLSAPTKEKLEIIFIDPIISEIDPNNPDIRDLQIIEMKIYTRGGYSEKKYNRTVKDKYEGTVDDIETLFVKKLKETGKFSEEDITKLEGQLSEKLNNKNILISAKNATTPIKSEDPRNGGYIMFNFSEEEARITIHNKVLNDIKGILNRKPFTDLPYNDAAKILDRYLKNNGCSNTVEFDIVDNNVTLRIPDNISLDHLREFNQFVNSDIYNPLTKGFPEELKADINSKKKENNMRERVLKDAATFLNSNNFEGLNEDQKLNVLNDYIRKNGTIKVRNSTKDCRDVQFKMNNGYLEIDMNESLTSEQLTEKLRIFERFAGEHLINPNKENLGKLRNCIIETEKPENKTKDKGNGSIEVRTNELSPSHIDEIRIASAGFSIMSPDYKSVRQLPTSSFTTGNNISEQTYLS